ncbi:MBL fold metallo-hydrolase [Brevundimonas sp. 2R-24]|uniref:MBL fold metallo-hydrolase n=1 Tax=Peiella sedimenti TaxID=3061083 RepID=A0ABT8SJU3_9CAUL|nr:MBL fold metallo-hydrolase [Caulobacteraceae bacterium XZ-24]
MIRWAASLGLILAITLAAPGAHGQSPAGAYETLRLIDGVRVLMNPADHASFASSNVVIIEQADGLVVVDSGFSRADGDQIVSYIRSFTAKPVKALIYTHWHNDHHQGASQIQAAWPQVRIIATEAARRGIDGPARLEGVGYETNPAWEALLAGQLRDVAARYQEAAANPENDAWRRHRFGQAAQQSLDGIPALVGTRLTAPTELFTADLVIDDPLRPVHIRHLGRANTDGDLIVWLPNQRVVATGDIVVSPIPFGFGSYPGDWIETLGRIKALGFHVLIPGHGLPQSDSAYIDRLIAAIADIRTRVGALAAEGLTLEQVRERVDYAEQTAIFGPSPARQANFQSLWLSPMTENAYKEATGVPIVQGQGELP